MAGTGIYLDNSDKDMIEVPKNPMTVEANFALQVRGDSMDPELRYGDTILIKTQPCFDIDEIGVFILNGEGFVKKLGKNRLISLNCKYKDIIIREDDEIICKGKVLGRL